MTLPDMVSTGVAVFCVLPPLLGLFDKGVRKLLFQILLRPGLLFCLFGLLWFLYLYGFLLLDRLMFKFVLLLEDHQYRELIKAGLHRKYADLISVRLSRHFLYLAVTDAVPWFCALLALVTEWKLIARFRGKRAAKPSATQLLAPHLPHLAGVVLFLSAVLAPSLWGQDPAEAPSQSDMNDEAYASFMKTDAKLNATYKEVFRLYDDDPLFLKKLRIAQRKWIEFRNAQIQAHFPEGGAYGSATPMCSFALLEQLTRERTTQLQVWLDGADEGEVCTGTVKLKEDLDKARKDRAPPAAPSPVKKRSENLPSDVSPSLCFLNPNPNHTPK